MVAAFDPLVLPHVNATLNALAFVFITASLVAVKRGNVELHKKLILCATAISALFLVSYLVYHFSAPPVKFRGEGWVRPVYFFILITHIVLAAVQVPLILRTLWLGYQDRREQHRKWAKVTAPIWLYVSVTGVVVYLFLYQW